MSGPAPRPIGLPPDFVIEGDLLKCEALSGFLSQLIDERGLLKKEPAFFSHNVSEDNGLVWIPPHCCWQLFNSTALTLDDEAPKDACGFGGQG